MFIYVVPLKTYVIMTLKPALHKWFYGLEHKRFIKLFDTLLLLPDGGSSNSLFNNESIGTSAY